jgi:demethylmenaquinone methyltransferase/2-methoxy-6-polyprenyl-1,4-benzoquinol methylase
MGQLTAQNPSSIREMFGRISSRYDLANTVLSFGIHYLWKRRVIKESKIQKGNHVLDCATGTGDLAFMFESKLRGTGQVVGSDFCEPMLEMAREKAKQKGSQVQFQFADVMKLPFADQSFHCATISFGIRNVKNPQLALTELARVVKPGGKVLVLEFGQPLCKITGFFYGIYSKLILPKIGGWISGQPEAYQYLQTSSAAFPCADEFLEMARSTGKFSSFKSVRFQTGIAYLYILGT